MTLTGTVNRLSLSPRADRVLMRIRDGLEWRTQVVGADGSPRQLEGGLRPVGWSGRDRMVLMDYPDDDTTDPTRLLLVQADTGETREIFP